MKQYELKAIFDRCKSFYGKATVTELRPGDMVLKSYRTDVLRIKDGAPFRLWNDYSATTLRHVNELMRQSGLPGYSKKEWKAAEYMPEMCPSIKEWIIAAKNKSVTLSARTA